MKAPGVFFPARPSALKRLLTEEGIKNIKKKSTHYWKQEDNEGDLLQL